MNEVRKGCDWERGGEGRCEEVRENLVLEAAEEEKRGRGLFRGLENFLRSGLKIGCEVRVHTPRYRCGG